MTGCIGITQVWIGRYFRTALDDGLKECYTTLGFAQKAQQAKSNVKSCSKGGARNIAGGAAEAAIIGYTFNEIKNPDGTSKWTSDPKTGRISYPEGMAFMARGNAGPVFDVGYYDPFLNAFWHAYYDENTPGTAVKISTPARFVNKGQSSIYCVVCQSDEILKGN